MNKLLIIENDRINDDVFELTKDINRVPAGRYIGTRAFLIKAYLEGQKTTIYNVKRSEIFKNTVEFSRRTKLMDFYLELAFDRCPYGGDMISKVRGHKIIIDSMFNVMMVYKDGRDYWYETSSILGNPKESTSKTEIIKDMKAEIDFDCESQLLNLLNEVESKPELFTTGSFLQVSMTEDEAKWFQGKTPEARYVRSLFKCASTNINKTILIKIK